MACQRPSSPISLMHFLCRFLQARLREAVAGDRLAEGWMERSAFELYRSLLNGSDQK